MALNLPDPTTLEQTIKLLKADPTGDTFVRVKQATTGDNAQRSLLWAKTSLEWDDKAQGRVRQYNEISQAQIMAEEVWLTLLECNIGDEDGKPVFPNIDIRARRPKDNFLTAWNSLPFEWAQEIHEAVLEANPQWNPRANVDVGEA